MRRVLGAMVVVLLCAGCVPPEAASPALPPSSPAPLMPSSSPATSVPSWTERSADSPPVVTSSSALTDALEVVALLRTLPVKGRAPKTGYGRALFGPAWTDDVTVDGGHNGCDTRNDILRRDLTVAVIKPGSNGCTVLSGVLRDPYTGRTIRFERGQATSGTVQIDHVVALLDAWQKGAQQLSRQQREDLANDPLNLQAVDGPTNQSKGAGDAASWLPPSKAYRCAYVTRQVHVKSRYGLWVTGAEKEAMLRVLGACGAASSPESAPVAVPPPDVGSTEQGCHPLSNGGHCYRSGEMCAARYRGTDGVDAYGEPIRCVQQGDYWKWVRR